MIQFPIPLTTARGMGPLPDILDEMAGSAAIRRSFRVANLPLLLIDEPTHKIPMRAMIRLFEGAAREVGDRTFGLRVGAAMSPDAYGLWTAYAAGAPSLSGAVERLCRTMAVQQTCGGMKLRFVGNMAKWTYLPESSLVDHSRQHADHIVPTMIAFARRYLGSTWLPIRVETYYDDDGYRRQLEDFLPVQWEFQQEGVSLVMTRRDVKTQLDDCNSVAKPIITTVDLLADTTKSMARNPAYSIEAILTLGMLDGNLSLDYVASHINQSTRSVQRALSRSGLSYRQVLGRVRQRKALALLSETSLSVSEIAGMLGYDDLANFSRAFRRGTGRSPSAFRRSLRTLAK